MKNKARITPGEIQRENQNRGLCFCAWSVVRLVICVWVGAVVFCAELQAQSIRTLLKQRSEPSAVLQKTVDHATTYSEAEMRLIDGRSVLDAQAVSQLGLRSEFAPPQVNMLDSRSVFSPANERMLDKRSEPDVAQTTRIRRYSQPESRLLKRDHVFDPVLGQEVLKRSHMSSEEKARMFRAMNQAVIYPAIKNSSVGSGDFDRQVAKRSVPESDWLKRIRNHSVD